MRIDWKEILRIEKLWECIEICMQNDHQSVWISIQKAPFKISSDILTWIGLNLNLELHTGTQTDLEMGVEVFWLNQSDFQNIDFLHSYSFCSIEWIIHSTYA